MTTQRSRPRVDPLLKKERVNAKIPQWLIDWLDGQDEARGVLIEHALIEQFGLVPPVIPLKLKS